MAFSPGRVPAYFSKIEIAAVRVKDESPFEGFLESDHLGHDFCPERTLLIRGRTQNKIGKLLR